MQIDFGEVSELDWISKGPKSRSVFDKEHKKMERFGEPRVYKPANQSDRVQIKMPYSQGIRYWLRDVCGPGTRPDFDRDEKVWTVARKHERQVVNALARRFGSVLVIHDYNTRETCTASCQNAMGDECTCSCGAENHGGGEGQGRHWLNGRGVAVQDEIFVKWTTRRKCHRISAREVQNPC